MTTTDTLGINRCDNYAADELGALGDATHEALDELEARFRHLHFVRLGRHLEATQRYEPEPESIGYSPKETKLSLANTFPAPLAIDMVDHLVRRGSSTRLTAQSVPENAPNVKTLELFDVGDTTELAQLCRERGIELVLQCVQTVARRI